MIARRVALVGSVIVLLGVLHLNGSAFAQADASAVNLIQDTSDRLVKIANSSATREEKRERLRAVIDANVDVDEIARFCLGRFWTTATPEQRKDYVRLFRDLLLTKISSHFSEYSGVRVTMGRGRIDAGQEVVNTTVERRNTAAMQVDWVVSRASGGPKVVDLLAGGTSLRMTHSNDFNAYLARHQNNVHELVEGMRRLVALSQ